MLRKPKKGKVGIIYSFILVMKKIINTLLALKTEYEWTFYLYFKKGNNKLIIKEVKKWWWLLGGSTKTKLAVQIPKRVSRCKHDHRSVNFDGINRRYVVQC